MNHSDSDTKRYKSFAWPLPRDETVPRTERRIASLFGVGLLTLVIVISGLLTAAPASGESAWDPNDVQGPLDLRWIGASFIPHDRFKLTLSFYNLRLGALPHRRTFQRGVVVTLTDFLLGLYRVRADRHVVFVYGDFASSCCARAHVQRTSRNVLRVVFPTEHDPADLTYRVHAVSKWQHHAERVRDRTRWLRLGRPPGD